MCTALCYIILNQNRDFTTISVHVAIDKQAPTVNDLNIAHINNYCSNQSSAIIVSICNYGTQFRKTCRLPHRSTLRSFKRSLATQYLVYLHKLLSLSCMYVCLFLLLFLGAYLICFSTIYVFITYTCVLQKVL